MIDYSTLNPRQKEAVLSNDEKIMVIAGAGSGKTKVLTTRIARLYNEGVNPSELLALTFTNKAGKEMKERIEKITNVRFNDIQASTFHSFAVKILRLFIDELDLGYSKNFKIFDEEDEKKAYINIFKEENMDNNEDKLWKDYASYRRMLLVAKLINKDKYLEQDIINKMFRNNLYPAIIDKFNESSRLNNSLTFDELIIYLCSLLKFNKKVFDYCQFKYVLVDEYQDTDEIQNEIVDAISQKYGNIFVVGDDSQCIYAFRGANVKTMKDFARKYHAKVIKLEQNYRSTPEILNLANQVISFNDSNIQKELFTENKHDDIPSYFKAFNDKIEAKKIVNEVKLLNRKGINYEDMAVLYRVNSLSRYLEQAFLEERIPYVIYNGLSFFQREEIKDIIAYIRLIADDYDNLSLKRIIGKPRRKIGDKTINELEHKALLNSNSSTRYSILNEMAKSDDAKLKDFYNKIITARNKYLDKAFESIQDLLPYILYDIGYLKYLETLKDSITNNREANIQELQNIISEFERNDSESDKNTMDYLNEFVQNIMLYTDIKNDDNCKNKVKLMTVHASKGLEFDVVFLPALESQIFPNANNEDMEEERRLYYVAITRAKKKLFISSSRQRMFYGQQKAFEESIFITDSRGKIAKEN